MTRDMALGATRIFVLSLLPLLVIPTNAQKQENPCQIMARVNGETIPQSAYLAMLKDYREDLARQMRGHGKEANEIEAELERRKPSVLDGLVDEFLLAQRGRELGFDAEVELKRMEESTPADYRDIFPHLEDALRNSGTDLDLARAARRRQALGQRALQEDVLKPIFDRITESERRDFYTNHKEEFMLPATVTLSEVILPFHGHSESEVAQSAVKLLAELQAGADFFKAVAENTPPSRPSFDKRGSVGKFRLDDVKVSLADDLRKLNPGEFTHPMRFDSGYQIIRLDARAGNRAQLRGSGDADGSLQVAHYAALNGSSQKLHCPAA